MSSSPKPESTGDPAMWTKDNHKTGGDNGGTLTSRTS